jgi:hypothetical protein
MGYPQITHMMGMPFALCFSIETPHCVNVDSFFIFL